MNKSVAIGLGVAGLVAWYFPGFNGIFFEPAQITAGESRIVAAILSVGGIILWFLPQTEEVVRRAMEKEFSPLKEDNRAIRQQLADIKIYSEAAWHETQQIRASEANRNRGL